MEMSSKLHAPVALYWRTTDFILMIRWVGSGPCLDTVETKKSFAAPKNQTLTAYCVA